MVLVPAPEAPSGRYIPVGILPLAAVTEDKLNVEEPVAWRPLTVFDEKGEHAATMRIWKKIMPSFFAPATFSD